MTSDPNAELMAACKGGEVDRVLLEAGGDVDTQHGQFQFTPLMGQFLLAPSHNVSDELTSIIAFGPDLTVVLAPSKLTYRPVGVQKNIYDTIRKRARPRVGKTATEMCRNKAERAVLRRAAEENSSST